MARNGVNKVILVGNVGQAPEIRALPNGTAVATFSIATSETWKDKESDELREQTEWHRVVCYRKLAEIVEKYVGKGTKIYVEGRLRTRKWKDNAGNDRSSTEVQVDDFRLLDGRKNGPETTAPEAALLKTDKKPAAPSPKPSGVSNFSDLENMEFDDDIPF